MRVRTYSREWRKQETRNAASGSEANRPSVLRWRLFGFGDCRTTRACGALLYLICAPPLAPECFTLASVGRRRALRGLARSYGRLLRHWLYAAGHRALNKPCSASALIHTDRLHLSLPSLSPPPSPSQIPSAMSRREPMWYCHEVRTL